MVMLPSRPVTALIVLILGVILVVALSTAGGHSKTRLQQFQGLNATAVALEHPTQLLAFCNATGDCTSNRQHVDCQVARADSMWPHEVALEPRKGAKLGKQFGKDLPCGMAREFSLAAFEGIMLMLLMVSIPIVLYRRRSSQALLPL